jgi:hypothetical protein
MTLRALPPGWPRSVPPPAGDEWVPDAVGWLLDRCPPEYRGYAVLRRHPQVLAVFTAAHVAALRAAANDGLASARSVLAEQDAHTISEAIALLEAEQARLELLARAVAAVRYALERAPAMPADAGQRARRGGDQRRPA